MCIFYYKLMIVLGLVMAFFGWVFMIKSKRYGWEQDGKQQMAESTGIEHPKYYKLSWFLAITGYLLQIAGALFV